MLRFLPRATRAPATTMLAVCIQPTLPPWLQPAALAPSPHAARPPDAPESVPATAARARVVLVEDPCLGCRAQLRKVFLAARFTVRAHHRFRARKAVTHP